MILLLLQYSRIWCDKMAYYNLSDPDEMDNARAHLKLFQIPTESEEQIGFVTWWNLKFPDVLCFHIPNGGYRDVATATRFKKEGVVPGVPDLFIPKYRLFVEMKRVKNGVVSKEQQGIMEYLDHVGYRCIVGYGAEDASRKVMEIINDERGEI